MYFEVPFNLSSTFIGRGDICEELRITCLPSEKVSPHKSQRRFVLFGLGGSGKTQVALKFASDHRERYDKINLSQKSGLLDQGPTDHA